MSVRKIRLCLSGYRCYREDKSLDLTIGGGMTAVVGLNNSGKSTALRSVNELRPVFEMLSIAQNRWNGIPPSNLRFSETIRGSQDPFGGDSSAQIRLDLDIEADNIDDPSYRHQSISYALTRKDGARPIQVNGKPVDTRVGTWSMHGPIMRQDGEAIGLDTPIGAALSVLASARYYPAFRNLVPGAASQYYDIQLGTTFIEAWNSAHAGPDDGLSKRIDAVTEDVRRLL
ncbi:MAG: hypothetical protein K2Q20_14610, partial [Phycisphaerales bacterium]|nr:hypothetical protein [Phycisphaerales bacterium]